MSKTMAAVLAEHHDWAFDLGSGEVLCVGCDWSQKVGIMDPAADAFRTHQAAALSAAGFGLVTDAIVIHVAHDTEAHARSFNEGYETAMAQELADDPTTAQDWLDAKLADAKAEALREAALALVDVNEHESRMPGIRFAVGFLSGQKRAAS